MVVLQINYHADQEDLEKRNNSLKRKERAMQALVSLEWAIDYFTLSRPKADEWDAVDNAERYKYLNWASTLIKSTFVFHANVEVDNDDRIRVAVCEQALYLMRRTDEYPEVLTKGIVSASAGPMSATFSKDFVAPLICEEAKMAVAEIGSFVRAMGVVKTMPLGGPFAEPIVPLQKTPVKMNCAT